MTLRFHRQLYDGKAVDAAVKQFEDFATFELSEEPEYWVVGVGGASDEELRELVGELGNFALGLTIQQRGQR
jgi:hypothetical protein